jgi:hypothetical protein
MVTGREAMKNRTKLVVVSYVGRVALSGVLVAVYSWLPPAHATGIAAMAMMACVGIAAMCAVSDGDRIGRVYDSALRLKKVLDAPHWTDAHIPPSAQGTGGGVPAAAREIQLGEIAHG